MISATLVLIAASKIVRAFSWNSSESSSPAISALISSSTSILSSATTSSSVVSSSATTSSVVVSSSETTSSVVCSSSATTSSGFSSSSLTPFAASAGFAPLLTTSLTCLREPLGTFNLAESSSAL